MGMLMMLAPMTSDAQSVNDFVTGADVGFLTAQERHGVVFHDREGRERD